MVRLSLFLFVALAATPALADNQAQRVQKVQKVQKQRVERVVVDDYGNSQDVVANDYYQPQQVIRERVIVRDNDNYERHLQNQARIRAGLGLGVREALRIQRLRDLQRIQRQRDFVFDRRFSRQRDLDFLLLNQSGPFFDPFSVFPRRRFIPGRSFIQFGF
jgi:CII-binding regulator of phage lambda lysogenization HflD